MVEVIEGEPRGVKMVEVIESTLVVPCEETPRVKLRLSNFEQVAPPTYTCTVYSFKNNGAKDFFSIDHIKAALARALVPFYPLAGRLVVLDDGRMTVDCNAEGALLVVAHADSNLDEINFEPSAELRNKFVPKSTTSFSNMTMLQVTYFKCGGVVLGCANNHILIDGRSAFHFFQTWARISRGEISSIEPPTFDSTPILARSPPAVTFDHPEYTTEDQEKKNTAPPSSVITKLKLTKEQIGSLKSKCIEGSHTTRVSTFCALSALFWKCYCIAQELPPDTETQLQFAADVRERLQPPLPQKFFGNAVIRTSAAAEVSKITSNSIHVAANAVKAAIDKITDEYVRSFIDYVEVNVQKKLKPVKELPKSALRIANITGMPVYEADFGWGAPQLMTWAQATGSNVVYIINEPEDAGVAAYVLLSSDTMDKFEKAFQEEMFLLNPTCRSSVC